MPPSPAPPVLGSSSHMLRAQWNASSRHDREPRDVDSERYNHSLNFDGMTTRSIDEHYSRAPSTGPRSAVSSGSLADSARLSMETDTTSLLPALQTKGAADDDCLDPLEEEEYDPASFDLVVPSSRDHKAYSLEHRSNLLFSGDHMAVILGDSTLLGQLADFLLAVRPASVPLLTYYLESEKALRAIRYANAVTAKLTALRGQDFTAGVTEDTTNQVLQARRDAAFEALTRDELPMFVTHVWIRIVSLSIQRRIGGTMPSHLRSASEGLAEVFCLTDPSRHDNPIILGSDQFYQTTQYGLDYVIGRNCRFLQGPGTNPFSIQRIRDRIMNGQEHYETFLNYRRDGSPFLNLLMCAPLIDSRGQVRYFLGAQVDVSGLAKDCAGLDGLKQLVKRERNGDPNLAESRRTPEQRCREMSELFSRDELSIVRRHGGTLRQKGEGENALAGGTGRIRAGSDSYVVIEDGLSPEPSPQPTNSDPVAEDETMDKLDSLHLDGPRPGLSGQLAGVYEHYLLVRPAPSLRILFASPSLRVPGMLQSPFLSRIGGSGRVRDQVAQALGDGRGVTAKVRWLSSTRRQQHTSSSSQGRRRWLHCTPLRGANGAIGIWMVVLVDEENVDLAVGGPADAAPVMGTGWKSPRVPRPTRVAPPIPAHIDSGQQSFVEAYANAGDGRA